MMKLRLLCREMTGFQGVYDSINGNFDFRKERTGIKRKQDEDCLKFSKGYRN